MGSNIKYRLLLFLMNVLFISSFSLSALRAQKNSPVLLPPSTMKKDKSFKDIVNYANDPSIIETSIDGKVLSALITESGDTLILHTLEDISITSLRKFKSAEDYAKYMKFKRYAALVYPFAKEAIRIFRETEYFTQNMSKRKRKKHIKKLQEELKTEFEEPLKSLTKLQGKILVKMIEKELDKSMFDLIKGLRGKLTAFYWSNASKLYSYDLKAGYVEGRYEILDAVLQDFDISYRIQQDELKEKNKGRK